MKKIFLFLPFMLFLLAAQDLPPVAIVSPAPGEVLRGQVNIIGSTNVPDFISAQLDFSYASAEADTWFPLQTLSQGVFDSPLYTWDTTAITDGDYILRLRVITAGGSTREVTVSVTLQNDIVPVTPTLAPTTTAESEIGPIPTPFLLAASPTVTDIPRPTPSPLPVNPASLDSNTILLSLGRGAIVILGVFALAGLIVRIRRF